MKYNGITILITVAMIQGYALQAQPAATKIAVVNGQSVLFGTREGERALDQLKIKADTRKKEFESRQNEIVQLEDQLNKGGAVMTEEKRAQLSEVINDKKKRFQRDVQDAEDDSQKEYQQSLQPLSVRADAIIAKFAADSGYSVVLDVSTPGSPVRYAASMVDITMEVIALYDKTYGDGKVGH